MGECEKKNGIEDLLCFVLPALYPVAFRRQQLCIASVLWQDVLLLVATKKEEEKKRIDRTPKRRRANFLREVCLPTDTLRLEIGCKSERQPGNDSKGRVADGSEKKWKILRSELYVFSD